MYGNQHFRAPRDAARTELTDPLLVLTEQQRLFVKHVVSGDPPKLAARKAGYASPREQGGQLMRTARVQRALRFSYQRYEKSVQMTRKRVLDGLLEGIEMAKIQADANTMVNGWREIGKMCGYYAPEVKQIDISITAKRMIGQLETLSDADLLKMVEDSGEIIEGEAEKVLLTAQMAQEQAP